MIDRSGQPRRDEEIDEAIKAIETIMVKHSMVLPLFTVNAMCIRDCLVELRVHRMEEEAYTTMYYIPEKDQLLKAGYKYRISSQEPVIEEMKARK